MKTGDLLKNDPGILESIRDFLPAMEIIFTGMNIEQSSFLEKIIRKFILLFYLFSSAT